MAVDAAIENVSVSHTRISTLVPPVCLAENNNLHEPDVLPLFVHVHAPVAGVPERVIVSAPFTSVVPVNFP